VSAIEDVPESTVIARMHAGDPIAERLGIELVETHTSGVRLRMVVDDRHLGGHAQCHGGVLFTLADVAMSYVSNRSNLQAVATHASIDLIDAVRDGEVIDVDAVEANVRGRAAICDVTMSVGDRVVAKFRGRTLRTRGLVTDIY
jgi:acyl-CoA thioesterase